MFDLDAWVDGDALTEVSGPGWTGLGEEDTELSSKHVDNLEISKHNQIPFF